MKLPSALSRRKLNVHKNQFGHVLILAGSQRYLGAAALCGLSAMRSGAGLVTVGVPKSLNITAQKKMVHVLMTWPLQETKEGTLASSAFRHIKEAYASYNVIALGPGLSQNPSTQRLILKIIATSPIPLVIDADALNALAQNLDILKKTSTPKILTPHPGEMARLLNCPKTNIEKNREHLALTFAQKHSCTLLLKGHKTVVASPGHKTYINTTGNPGMATAGSGDVLTGMIAAFLAQGLSSFDAAKYGAYLHGLAGDLAAKNKPPISMIATDLIDAISKTIKNAK